MFNALIFETTGWIWNIHLIILRRLMRKALFFQYHANTLSNPKIRKLVKYVKSEVNALLNYCNRMRWQNDQVYVKNMYIYNLYILSLKKYQTYKSVLCGYINTLIHSHQGQNFMKMNLPFTVVQLCLLVSPAYNPNIIINAKITEYRWILFKYIISTR